MSQKFYSGTSGFGWVELNEKKYPGDFIIHADGSISKRRKELSKKLTPINHHTPLGLEELSLLSGENPDIIYIGTGQKGSLPLTEDAKILLENYQVWIDITPVIIAEVLKEERKFIAIIHVTC